MLTHRAAYPAVAGSVAEARHFVAMQLSDMGCPEAMVGDAALLVSELAANAVVHARTPFTIAFDVAGEFLTIEVADRGDEAVRPRVPDRYGGRGLHIVDAVAHDWGVRHQSRGKTVFVTLPCPTGTRVAEHVGGEA